jgi:hypothetical protein
MQLQNSFEGYGYRTSSRVGSWTRITVEGDTVSVTGPRVGVLPHRLWIVAQFLVLALVAPAVLVPVVVGDWRYLLLVPALLILNWCVGVAGAAGLWEMANLAGIGAGHPIHHFPVTSVKRVKIGAGWARNGPWLVILPYVAGSTRRPKGIP